jgi:hypothetical protein
VDRRLARQSDNAKGVARRAAVVVPEVVRALPRDMLADALGRSLVAGLKAVPAGLVAGNLLAIVWAQGQTQKVLERVLAFAETSLLANKAFIRARVEANSSRWVPRWLDGMVADKIVTTVTATLAEMRDPAHPWRVELKAGVEGLVERLGTDQICRPMSTRPRTRFSTIPSSSSTSRPCGEKSTRACRPMCRPRWRRSRRGRIRPAQRRTLDPENPALRWINNWIRYLVRRTFSPPSRRDRCLRHQRGGGLGLHHPRQPAELQVGKDLQYIRINGNWSAASSAS